MIEPDVIIEEAYAFAQENIRPYASVFEENEEIPKELIKKLADKKYLGAPFPEEYGGLNIDPVQYGLLTEAIGKACSTTRSILTVHTSLVGETLLRWGTEEQKAKWLPLMANGSKIGAFALTEPEVGTDAKSVQTQYVETESGFLINGKKKWITLGDIADFFLVIAKNDNNVTAFLIERTAKGVFTKPIKGLIAAKASHIAEIEFNNVEVKKENIIGKQGVGFSHIVNTALNYGRYSIAWGGLALAQEALDAMVSYARSRSQFNQKIYNFQLIQGMIGDAVTKIHAARALCLNAGKLRKEGHDDAIIESTIAKHYTATIAQKISSDAVQVHGGNGCYNKYPVERLYREAKILEIIEGTSQIQAEIIARFGLRRYYKQYFNY